MIIKGKSRSNAAQAGNYLLRQGKNERVELIETRGTLADDVKGACREMEALAAGSCAEKPFYHASINPVKGETLTPEQWALAVDLLEKKLGLEDHQRIVVEHEKEGRAHRHILWNRVDSENLKAVRMSWNYVQHEQTAREIENAFQLEKVQGVHVSENGELREKDEARPTYAPNRKEIENAKKTGVNLYKWREEIREIAQGRSGEELIDALEAKGHMVAAGDKVAFLILDPSGKPHRMAQSLGLKVADLKDRLEGVEAGGLPREAEARERQKKQQAQLEKEKGFTMYDSGGMVSQQSDALQHAKDRAEAKERGAGAIGKERELPNLTKEQQKHIFDRAKERAARGGEAAPSQYADLKGREKPEEQPKKKTQAEEKRDHKRATTEQTDSKQRRSARDALKEAFETDFSKFRKNTGDGRELDGGRERERER